MGISGLLPLLKFIQQQKHLPELSVDAYVGLLVSQKPAFVLNFGIYRGSYGGHEKEPNYGNINARYGRYTLQHSCKFVHASKRNMRRK
jgi:hypothetical protein